MVNGAYLPSCCSMSPARVASRGIPTRVHVANATDRRTSDCDDGKRFDIRRVA
jgi:hypothetical protein